MAAARPRRTRLDVSTALPLDAVTQARPRKPHPLDTLMWVEPKTLTANDYNPNHVFPPELELLKLSILEDGWTQPVVAIYDGRVIVDGFHRWTLSLRDPEIIEVSGGLCPTVFVSKERGEAIAATILHNRARGQHGIVQMGKLVRELIDRGMSEAEVGLKLGMESEEVARLIDFRPSPETAGLESFGKGWVPRAD